MRLTKPHREAAHGGEPTCMIDLVGHCLERCFISSGCRRKTMTNGAQRLLVAIENAPSLDKTGKAGKTALIPT